MFARIKAGRGRRARSWTLVLALTSFAPFSGSGPLFAQGQQGEARVMNEADRKSLKAWAVARLEELDREGFDPDPSLPHNLDTERLWAFYFLSVEEREWEDRAVSLADSLVGLELPEALEVRGLSAALEVVRAKNSRWPPNKLKHLRTGLSQLNQLVDLAPADPVLRYLRLMSCYYLPFFLDQDDLVEEDMAALVSLLPQSAEFFSPHVFEGVVEFVLENAELGAAARESLFAALENTGVDA